jgi:hypothetical protein
MKIKKSHLVEIIKEEIKRYIKENVDEDISQYVDYEFEDYIDKNSINIKTNTEKYHEVEFTLVIPKTDYEFEDYGDAMGYFIKKINYNNNREKEDFFSSARVKELDENEKNWIVKIYANSGNKI